MPLIDSQDKVVARIRELEGDLVKYKEKYGAAREARRTLRDVSDQITLLLKLTVLTV